MKRTLAVGDIHGGLRALKQVLERAELKSTDHLIFLGDFVDGWSESAQLIDYLIELSKQQTCHFIFGNHDAWCFDWLITGIKNDNWLMHGGVSTVQSYKGYSYDDKNRHIRFFQSTKNYFVDDENRLFIHAGFSSPSGPDKQLYDSNSKWDRTLWEKAMQIHNKIQKNEKDYPKRLKLFSEIFIGHTPTTKWNIGIPWQCANVWNIDTGAAFKGKLSVMDVHTKEYWQSDPVMELYPNESGRNPKK